MHDKLFANFNKLSQESIAQIAKDLNLDMVKFQADMRSPKTNHRPYSKTLATARKRR